MNISEEALSAACDAYWKNGRSVHAAIEAAAPHMLAAAWDDGEGAGYSAGRQWPDMHAIENPYRSEP